MKWMRVQNGLWEARINNVLWLCARTDYGQWRLSLTAFGCNVAPRRTLAECKALAEATERLWEGE